MPVPRDFVQVSDADHGHLTMLPLPLDAVLGNDGAWRGLGAAELDGLLHGPTLPGLPWPRRIDQLVMHDCQAVYDEAKFDRVLSIFGGKVSSADQYLARCRDALAAGTLLPLYPITIIGSAGARVTGRRLHEIQ